MNTTEVLIISWLDAGSASDVGEASNYHRKSIGYPVKQETGKGVWISMEPDQLSGVHFIPWGMISKIETVQVPND